jgi:hypothetical protein
MKIDTDLYGTRFIRDVPAWGNAGCLLKEMGIEWDEAVVLPIPNESCWSKGINYGAHVYFMKDGCDVAYYTFLLSSLTIHGRPRVWAAEFLSRVVSAYQI